MLCASGRPFFFVPRGTLGVEMPEANEYRDMMNPVMGMKKTSREAGKRLMKMVKPEKKKIPETGPAADSMGHRFKAVDPNDPKLFRW